MDVQALAGPKEQGSRLGQLAEAHRGLGDLERAAELADAAAELVRDSGGSAEHVRLARLRARIARAQGDVERSLDIMDRALDDQRNQRGESLTLALLGSTQRRIDEVEHVREVELAAVNDALTRTNADLATARDAAERAAQDRHAFLAAMSHELRTPLTGVLGSLELLGESELVPEQRALVEIIRRSGQLTLAVVDDILDLRKIQEGRLTLVERSFPLRRPVEDVVRLLRSQAARHGVVLTLAMDPRLPQHVHGDDRRLEQVLMNLVGNALKFTPKGSVTLRVDQVDQGVRFQVQDTGLGIRSEALPTLFEPYVQAHSPDQRVAGTGLGLAISHRLVQALGGDLTVTSTRGEGSTFSFTLVLPQAEEPPPRRTAGPPGTARHAHPAGRRRAREPLGRGPTAGAAGGGGRDGPGRT
jgi:signal transduction histidine kinase